MDTCSKAETFLEYATGRLFGFVLSQTSPIPSPSLSCWSALEVSGQLSLALAIPSPSLSVSQASPIPSLSESFWSTFSVFGQLSSSLMIPSPSMSSSQTSPIPSLSESAWSVLAVSGQLSLIFKIPSPSLSLLLISKMISLLLEREFTAPGIGRIRFASFKAISWMVPEFKTSELLSK